MPSTRSHTRNSTLNAHKLDRRSTSPLSSIPDHAHEPPLPPERSAAALSIEDNLGAALAGVTALRNELRALRSRNAALQRQLDLLHDAPEASIQPKPGRRASNSPNLNARIKQLAALVARLEKAKEKDRKRIKKLKRKEIEADAVELADEATHGVVDVTATMRRLLRRFHSLMLAPSFEEDEECGICLEKLTKDTARSLPCQHTLCADCLLGIQHKAATTGTQRPSCPHCRAPFRAPGEGVYGDDGEDEDIPEPACMTATEQWDALLDVARAWAEVEAKTGKQAGVRFEDESLSESEEEEEPLPFIVEEDEDDDDEMEDGVQNEDQEEGGETQSRDQTPGADDDDECDPRTPTRLRRMHTPPSPTPHPSQAPNSQEAQAQGGESPARTPSTPPPSNRQAQTRTPIATPLTPSRPSYQASPTSEKRKRMAELAAARAAKRRL